MIEVNHGLAEAKKSIFLVDDDQLYSMALDYHFRDDINYQLFTLKSGEECVEKMNHIRPDVIVLDYMMPGIDGLETLKRIKGNAPEIPVIMLSGIMDPKLKENMVNQGIYRYIHKADNAINTLNETLEDLLYNIQMEEQIASQRIWIGIGFAVFFIAFLCLVLG